jgi:hypothetical protein
MVKVYKFKDKYADFFCIKSLSEYQKLLSQNYFAQLQDRDQSGRRLFLFKVGKLTDATKWSCVGEKNTHTHTFKIFFFSFDFCGCCYTKLLSPKIFVLYITFFLTPLILRPSLLFS